MKKNWSLLFMLVLLMACSSPNTRNTTSAISTKIASNEVLKKSIVQIVSGKKADVGISLIGPDGPLDINGDMLYPMLSTVKFPIALCVLHQVEKGQLSMDQKIWIKKEALDKETWSPFRDKYPQGNISITLEEAINWMVAYSDNNLTDVLLQLIGGTETVARFINDKNFIIKNDEKGMHQNWEAQFVNKITPKTATLLLQQFAEGKILNQAHTTWLFQVMASSQTGLKRIKGKLPKQVIVAEKTGTSGTNKQGLTGAINDIGIIELPGKKKLYMAVFVHNTTESVSAGEELIADIAKASWDFYTTQAYTDQKRP